MNQTRTPRSVTSCAAVHITSRRASTRAPSLVFDSSKHEAFVGASQVESSRVVLRSLVDRAGRFRPNQPTPAPRLTDEPPTRAGANTMRRRSRVLRPLPFRPAPMTPSARRGFGDEPPSSRRRFSKKLHVYPSRTKPAHHSAPLASTTIAGVAILSGGCCVSALGVSGSRNPVCRMNAFLAFNAARPLSVCPRPSIIEPVPTPP